MSAPTSVMSCSVELNWVEYKPRLLHTLWSPEIYYLEIIPANLNRSSRNFILYRDTGPSNTPPLSKMVEKGFFSFVLANCNNTAKERCYSKQCMFYYKIWERDHHVYCKPNWSSVMKVKINLSQQSMLPKNKISIQLRWQAVDCQILTIKTHMRE